MRSANTPTLGRAILRPGILGPGALLLALLLALAAGLSGNKSIIDGRRTAIPVPLPVYDIESVSGNHTASLLNLPLGQPGVIQAPIPVDINGDLLPDVTAAVNLVNAEGVFNNPPVLGQVIAPNIEFTRLITAPILTPGGDPLRINVKLTLIDLEGNEPDMIVRFGMDTGPGGTIPPAYKALVGGLDTFFQPLQASIDTTGGLVNMLDPKLPDLGLTPQTFAYEGPLTTFARLDWGTKLNAKADIRFRAMPDQVEITYLNDDAGQHLTYAHTAVDEVDLDVHAEAKTPEIEAKADLRIDRLPRAIAVDILTNENGGGIKYQSTTSNGRLPDLHAEAELRGVLDRPLFARVDAESIPARISGEWNLPEDAPPDIDFQGSGQGIGAIEARVWNYETPLPTTFTPYVPKQVQHASLQAGPGGVLTDETLIQARLERLRGATVAGTADGALVGQVNIGDGEKPLEVHGELDLRGADKPYINATAVISPLPDQINFSVNPAGTDPIAEPTKILYEPSESIDIDTSVLVGLPGTTGAVQKGDPGTIYGELDLRHVPTRIEARIANAETESRFEVDAIPRPGGAPLDVFANAVLGPVDALGGPAAQLLAAPIYAELAVQGLPRFIRVRNVEDPAQNSKRFEVRTCDVDYTSSVCAPGTEDSVAETTFNVRNFSTRPSNLPAPPQSGPLFVTVVARGIPNNDELVNFEVAGRITDFKELTYVGTGTMTGVKTDVGGNQDFRAFVDAKDIDVGGTTPLDNRINVDADVRVQPLPAPFSFCFAQAGRTFGPSLDPITARCEANDPFGDGVLQQGPLTVSYDAPLPFSVITDIVVQGDFPFDQPDLPVNFGTFDRIAAHLGLLNLPSDFTAYIQTPEVGTTTVGNTQTAATRILTVAPGATNTKIEVEAELTTPGVSCRNPDPTGGAVCASVLVDSLPDYASVLSETVSELGGAPGGGDAVTSQRTEFHACDWQFYAGTPGCRAGTAGQIGVIEAKVRAHAGSGAEVPPYIAPATEPNVFAQLHLDDLSNFEVEAGLRVEEIRHIQFRQTEGGVEAHTDIGSGLEPLTVHAYADLQDTVDLVPDALKAKILAEVKLTPLPQLFDFVLDGPAPNQSGTTTISFDASSDILVEALAEIREVGSGPDCGDRGTVCATLKLDKLPNHLDATIEREFGPIVGVERDSDTEMHINTSDTLDIYATAAIGLPEDSPVVGDGPLFADMKLLGVPQHMSVGMENHEVLQPDLVTLRTSALEYFQFHTCDLDFDTNTCNGSTNDAIDLFEASVRTFDLRPTDFPTPPATHAPLYVGIAGRGKDVEGFVSIPEISEIQFVNRDGVTGAKARLGGTTPSVANDLDIRVDIKGLEIAQEITFGDQVIDDPRLDLVASVDVTPFPGELSFCMREGGITPVPAASGVAFTAVCEDNQPFGPPALGHTPLSVGFASNVTFDVGVRADLKINGNVDGASTTPIDQIRFVGAVDIDDMPTALEFHFLQPKQTAVSTPGGVVLEPSGPFRLLFDSVATSGIDVTFSAASLVGPQATCKDVRVNVSATCISGQILNLPTKAELFYNPELDLSSPSVDLNNPAHTQNFFLKTSGPQPLEINNIEFSSVTPARNADGSFKMPRQSDVIVATADFDPFPNPMEIRGTLDLPDAEGEQPTAIFEVQNGQSLPKVTVHVQNYISPDPTAGVIIPNRPVGTNALQTYQISAIMRGDAFKLDAVLPGLRKVGVKAIRDTLRRPIGTTQIMIGFAEDFNIRAFADLQQDPSTRAIVDALIEDLPAETHVCTRGPREGTAVGASPFPGQGTWCDSSAIADEEGALEIDMLPNTTGRKLDVDAFARLQFGGGGSIIAGRLNIDNIPQILRMRLPGNSDDFELTSFSRVGGVGTIVTDGIDEINFEAATFDLAQADTGYVGPLPYVPKVNGAFPFPAKAAPVSGEYVHAAADLPNADFHARGRLGGPAPSSQLQGVLFSKKPCPTPQNNPPDYPRLPTVDDHTCIRVRFDQHTGGIDPLALHVVAALPDGNVAQIRDAGLSDIPDWFQVNIAKAETFTDPTNERGWRRPCGPVTMDAGPCMSPMLRFDQPNNPYLFGVAEYGKRADIPLFDGIDPQRTAPNFDAQPTGTGWDGAFFDNSGIRVKIIDFDGGTLTDTSDDRIGAKATFRLPIPQSLTVDQVQSYDDNFQSPQPPAEPGLGEKASDFRFHMAIRRSNGTVVEQIGEFAAMLALVDSNAQVLLTQPCARNVVSKDALYGSATATQCPEYGKGIQLPGEVGLAMYSRDSIVDLPPDDGKPQMRSSGHIQVDGRLSTNVSVGARIIANGAEVTEGIRLGDVEVAIRNIPGGTFALGSDPYLPTFRLRAEIIKDAEREDDEEETDEETTSVFSFVTTINIRINRVFVGFDFAPTGTPARTIDAVIYLHGKQLSVDLKGWDRIVGASPSAVGAVATPFSFGFFADINPLNLNIRSVWNFASAARDAIRSFITDTLGAPGWLADVIDWLLGPVIEFIEAVLNALPIQVRLKSAMYLQFTLDRLSSFQMRVNLLHIDVDVTGPGEANIGPINWYIGEFSGGLDLDIPPIDIPDWIDWIPGVPDEIDIPPILLAGYAYLGGISFPVETQPPLLLDFRDCGSGVAGLFGSFVPFLGGGFDNTVTVDASDSVGDGFVAWIGTDPRMSLNGILLVWFAGIWTFAADFLLDLVAGPIFCKAFGVDPSEYQLISYTGAVSTFNPGNIGATAFPGHPVPGQPGQPATLPAELPPPTDPVPTPPPAPPSPGLPPPPAPPGALSPLYTGPGITVNAPQALCGVHSFNTLTLNSVITVATTAVAGNPYGTGTACTAANVGKLELRANTLTINATGGVVADQQSTDVAHFDEDGDVVPPENETFPQYRATGNSGGTHSGVGWVGAFPDSGFQSYERGTEDTVAYVGGPGHADSSYSDADIDADGTIGGPVGTIPSAGAAGLGGGSIVLKADTALTVRGTVSADGGNGTSDLGGTQDNDPDDNGIAGHQTFLCDHDGDNADPDPPNTALIPVLNPIKDGPPGSHGSGLCTVTDPGGPYEHTGFAGAGGGAGGGIAMQARYTVDIAGAVDISAHGGNGGSAHLGNGGGGGGGAIKVLGPHQVGVGQSALNAATVDGDNGSGTAFPGANVPSAPTFDNPDTIPVETDPQPTNGVGVIEGRPVIQLRPYGPEFFWPGGSVGTGAPAPGTFDSYYVGGGTNLTTIVTCAVSMATNVGAPDAAQLSVKANAKLPYVEFPTSGPPINHGSMPTLGDPCGNPNSDAGTVAASLIEIAPRRTITNSAVVTPAALSQDINTSGYYGLYTTAIRPRTVGNNCFSSADNAGLGVSSDATDCYIERLNGVEWMIGVDADRPAVGLPSPANGTVLPKAVVNLDITFTDQADLSGTDFLECQATGPGPTSTGWLECHDGDNFSLVGGDGQHTIEVRGYDKAGLISTTASKTVFVDQNAPTASANLSGGVLGGGGWYTSPPQINIFGYTAGCEPGCSPAPPPRDSPYAWRFDNGFESDCPVDTVAPFTCTVGTTETSQLATGEHTFHFTAVNKVGLRYFDDDDDDTPSPMQTLSLKLDGEKPLLELATVPFVAPRTFMGNPWFDTAPFLVVGALDQFGASGLASREIKIGAGPFVAYDPVNPPLAPEGVTTVCAKATDVAGNVHGDGDDPLCITVRVDSQSPSLTLVASHAPAGTGWYNIATGAPSFTVNTYSDGSGVGATVNHFRHRFDNGFAIDCNAPSCVLPVSNFPTGRHLIHANATDRFENRSGEITRQILVDLEPPDVLPIIARSQPDNLNGWYKTQPYLTLFATDPVGGDLGDPNYFISGSSGVQTVRYSLNGGVPNIVWTAPVTVPEGGGTLCWNATDVAGNTTPTQCQPLKVDLNDPTVTLNDSAAPNGNGWYGAPLTVTVTTVDPGTGSGVNQAFDPDLSDLCEDLTPAANPTTPSGTCVSVDRGPYVPYTGTISLGEGIHTLRAFAVDVSGRRGPVSERVYRVDLSPPVVDVRLQPPDPARNGWYRAKPFVVARADDGDQGSGVTSFEYRVDGGGWTTYTEPFRLTEGHHTVDFRASDMVGTRTVSKQFHIDTTPPIARATNPTPALWLRLLVKTVKLNYTIGDNLSGPLRVGVIIYDVTGMPVKRIDGGVVNVTPGVNQNGFVTWDGKDNSLLNLVPLGIYYYRVVVTDDAGNTAQGGESKPLTIRLL